jgi:xanthine dehydrogenase/oxidase
VTPYGQTLTACYMKEVWNYLKIKCRFDMERTAVDAFNSRNKWRKQGIALIPVKYGSGYNFEQLKQSSAIVVVNQADGSVVIHQGGVDMGQGLLTQVRQVAAYVLGIPMALIHVESPQTDTTPNTSSSGASTGTPYSAEAVKRTCEQLRQRLLEFGHELLRDNGDEWCKDNGIDFWNYGAQGWAAEVTKPFGRPTFIWQNLVQLAYVNRLSLTTAFNIDIEPGDFDMPVLTFKQPDDQPSIPGINRDESVTTVADVQKQFVGFTYSAACAVVEVDILTGETKILRTDIVYDMGWSLNPALDIGQIEGAFVQGIGFILTENLVSQPRDKSKHASPLEDIDAGRLNTVNTWRYKIPAHVTIPQVFNVSLFPRDFPSVQDIPPDDQGIFSAKEVGEPPLILANAVFFAIKDAVRASRKERGLLGLFNMRAPATPQEVANALAVDVSQLGS